jgi:hypothetical protein
MPFDGSWRLSVHKLTETKANREHLKVSKTNRIKYDKYFEKSNLGK